MNDEALDFYHAHGWVVLSLQIGHATCQQLLSDWSELCHRFSDEIGCSKEQYHQVISQWRDLWKTERSFANTIQKPISKLAAMSFDLPSTRLLHDHIISKSLSGGNGTVPWHQDSMYWPVDRTGMSTWTPLVDVPVNHGCLEVVSCSHLWSAATPVDFMSEDSPISDTTPTVLLPVEAGDIVLLHSRTWHRSAPTAQACTPRPAYIALWIPPATRYWPRNAQWHPLNDQVSVRESSYLNSDEFPIYGDFTEELGTSFDNKHEGVPKPFGMFDARSRIQTQVQELLGCSDSLSTLLGDPTKRRNLIDHLSNMQLTTNSLDIEQVIEAVWISAASFEKHRARNVFNSAYKDWEELTKGVFKAETNCTT